MEKIIDYSKNQAIRPPVEVLEKKIDKYCELNFLYWCEQRL